MTTSPNFPRTDQGLVERIDAALATKPVNRRKMFGTAAWFMDSNAQMFAGVWGDGIMACVGEEGAQKLIASGEAAAFDPMGGRPMREYVYVAADAIADDASLNSWLTRSAGFAATLPVKVKKK